MVEEKNRERIPPVVTSEHLEGLLGGGARVRLLDVRTPGEYEAVHIRGAYNVPLDTLDEHAEEIRRNVDDPVILVCQTGARARKAEEALRGSGMPNLHVLEDGLNGWLSEGKAVERGPSRISLERQVGIVAGALAAGGGMLALLVDPIFGLLPTFVGSGLVFAGATDTCGMALVLAKLPYNRPASCDVDAMVRALQQGREPPAPSHPRATQGRGEAGCSA